jgi:predicted dehydrogenase
MTMAEMTMISMAVLTATQKSRSFLEAAAGRKDLYLEEGPLEEGTLEIGTLGIGTLEKADVIYLPDYSSLDFRQVRELLKAGKHVLFGTMGAADAGSLKALAQTADEHGAVLLDHIHLAFNPCMASLKTALTGLGPIRRIRLHSCEYAFCCKGVRISPVRPPACVPPGGALFQRGADCLYPLVHLFGIPEQMDAQMVFTEHGMDAAGTVRGHMGTARVEIVYSKISGSHVPSLIEGERGSLLIRDLRNLKEVTYKNRSGAKKPLVSFSDEACRARELDRCMAFIKGKCSWHRQLASSIQTLQMMDEIRGHRNLSAEYTASSHVPYASVI